MLGLLDSILAHIPAMVCVLDESRRIRYRNQAFFRMYPDRDVAFDQYEPPHLREIVSDEDFKLLDAPLSSLIRTGLTLEDEPVVVNGLLRGTFVAELRLIAPERVLLYSVPRNAPIRVDSKADLDAEQLTLHQYLSEVEHARRRIQEQADQLATQANSLAQARDQALAATKAKSLFLANISHELRTPMNGILGVTQLLREEGLSPRQRELIEVIHAAGKDLLSLVSDVLDSAKIEAGKVELDLSPVNLKTLCANLSLLFEEQRSAKHATLSFNVDECAAHVCVVVDMLKLRQVLINLIGNALKFTAQEGRIEVHVTLSDPTESQVSLLRVSVRDNGIGIPKEKHHAIFHLFEQADSSITREYGGSGLGLSISSRLIEIMGGKITLESEVGVGSTFSIEVPVTLSEIEDSISSSRIAPTEVSLPHVSRHLLLVEDNKMNEMLASMMLERRGYTMEYARNGEEALTLFRAHRYDAILMDCQMPRMDGFEATRLIRQEEAQLSRVRTPIIAMTAHASQEDRAECLRAGMDEYISKPIDFDTLDRHLQQLAATEAQLSSAR